MKKKVLVFLPGDKVNVTVKFNATKTTVLKIEAIEIDNPENNDVLVNLDYE